MDNHEAGWIRFEWVIGDKEKSEARLWSDWYPIFMDTQGVEVVFEDGNLEGIDTWEEVSLE